MKRGCATDRLKSPHRRVHATRHNPLRPTEQCGAPRCIGRVRHARHCPSHAVARMRRHGLSLSSGSARPTAPRSPTISPRPRATRTGGSMRRPPQQEGAARVRPPGAAILPTWPRRPRATTWQPPSAPGVSSARSTRTPSSTALWRGWTSGSPSGSTSSLPKTRLETNGEGAGQRTGERRCRTQLHSGHGVTLRRDPNHRAVFRGCRLRRTVRVVGRNRRRELCTRAESAPIQLSSGRHVRRSPSPPLHGEIVCREA